MLPAGTLQRWKQSRWRAAGVFASALFLSVCSPTGSEQSVALEVLQISVADSAQAFSPSEHRQLKVLCHRRDSKLLVRLLVPEPYYCISPAAEAQQDQNAVKLQVQILPSNDFDMDCNGFLSASVVELALERPRQSATKLEITVIVLMPGRSPGEPWEWTGAL